MNRRGLAAAALVLAAAVLVIPHAQGAAKSTARKSTKKAAAGPGRDTVLARFGKDVLTKRMVEQRLQELPEPYRANFNTVEGRQQFVERLIEERTWWLGARKKGVDTRPDVRRQIEQSTRDLVIRTYVNESMAKNTAPADSEAMAHYDAHKDDYRVPATVTLSHILVKKEADARKVLKSARSKQDWKKLVARYSVDSLTRASDGSLGVTAKDGVFASIGRQPALAESAFAVAYGTGPNTGVGAIGGPWQIDKGWSVVKIDAVKEESIRPFDQVRNVIMRQLNQQRNQDFYKTRLTEEQKALGMVVDSAAIKSFVAQRKTAQELFKAGQEAGPPTTRIAAYTQLLQEYPDSDVSPQAQFMIGFIYSEELKDYDQAEVAFRELIKRYPNAELVDSARWMIEHMRTEDAPSFMNLDADSSSNAVPNGARRPTGTP